MTIYLDNRSGAPIYEQIVSQLKAQIISGALKEDEALPSIRTLAKDLRISVITTKRAYEELESTGFIYTVPGKGSFVAAKDIDLVREEHLRRIEQHMLEICKLAAACHISEAELKELYLLIKEDEK